MVQVGKGRIVRFRFDHPSTEQVYLVGDFNDWNECSHPMHRVHSQWVLDILLPPGEFEFKYLVGTNWFNDYAADKYVPNCWGSENSVVVVHETNLAEEIAA